MSLIQLGGDIISSKNNLNVHSSSWFGVTEGADSGFAEFSVDAAVLQPSLVIVHLAMVVHIQLPRFGLQQFGCLQQHSAMFDGHGK